MRIISQDKEFDLPYEETTIRALTNGTIAAFSLVNLESNDFIICMAFLSLTALSELLPPKRKRLRLWKCADMNTVRFSALREELFRLLVL